MTEEAATKLFETRTYARAQVTIEIDLASPWAGSEVLDNIYTVAERNVRRDLGLFFERERIRARLRSVDKIEAIIVAKDT